MQCCNHLQYVQNLTALTVLRGSIDSMTAYCRMKSYFQFGVVFCVIALAISASAGSIASFENSAIVSSVPNTSGHGGLNFKAASGSLISSEVTIAQSQSSSHNILPNALGAAPAAPAAPVTHIKGGDPQPMPEGGTQITYLVASGLVLFAGIFLAGKRRRPAQN